MRWVRSAGRAILRPRISSGPPCQLVVAAVRDRRRRGGAHQRQREHQRVGQADACPGAGAELVEHHPRRGKPPAALVGRRCNRGAGRVIRKRAARQGQCGPEQVVQRELAIGFNRGFELSRSMKGAPRCAEHRGGSQGDRDDSGSGFTLEPQHRDQRQRKCARPQCCNSSAFDDAPHHPPTVSGAHEPVELVLRSSHFSRG